MSPGLDLVNTAAQVACWSLSESIEAHERLLQRAPLIDIEAASACNARCIFCPRGAADARPRLMAPGTFATIVPFLPEDAVVMFSGFGEPLLNPHLEDFARSLKERGISPCVITNGLLLTPERQASLIGAGMDQFQISIHASTPENWQRLVGVERGFERVIANLEHLARHRPEGFRVNLNFVEGTANATEGPKIEKLARRLGFNLYTRRVHGRGGEVGTPRGELPAGCGIFASVTFIDAAGDVRACVNDVRGTTRLGAVEEISWSEVVAWKRERLRRGLELFPVCARCDDDYRFVILGQDGVDG